MDTSRPHVIRWLTAGDRAPAGARKDVALICPRCGNRDSAPRRPDGTVPAPECSAECHLTPDGPDGEPVRMEPESVPLTTRPKWRLLSKGNYHPGGCHGHQFDTEDEAKTWIAQPYVAGSYTYDCVDVIQCTCCKQWHIAIDGLQGWSCQP